MKALLPLLALAVGCVHTAPTPVAGEWIASDSSQYSPVARFRAHSEVTSTGVRIAIDSGTLTVPGEMVPDPPPLMSHLYLTAILAVPDSGSFAIVRPAADRAPAERRGWRPIATSDSVLLVEQLHYGERASFPAVQLDVRSPSLPSGRAWITYRISGSAVELSAPLVAGAAVRRVEHPGAVRVYACGDRDVRGSSDATRAANLRRAYGIAC